MLTEIRCEICINHFPQAHGAWIPFPPPPFSLLPFFSKFSNEEKTNDYENFEKGMIYMKILNKGGVVEKRGEEETKSMPHAPVTFSGICIQIKLIFIFI